MDAGLSHQYRVDNLVLTSSTSEAYSYLFKLLCDPGDVILVPEPSYPLFEQLARYEAVTLASYQLRYDGAWFIDIDSLRQSAKLNPKAIVVVTPNNPTGSCVSAQELQALCSIGAPLIVDQVFAPFVRADASLHLGLPLESDASLVFTLDGLSKRCALPQLKLAWTAVSGSAIAVESALRGLNHVADAFLSPNTLTQRALNALLNCSQQTTDSIRCRLDENWRTLENERARGWPVSLYHYQGGWAAMWRFPSFRSDDDWAHWCLERGVLVQPGWLYDCSEPSTLVVSLLTPPLVFAQAVQRLAESLASE